LSTDKAAAPINLYGATKLCSDKIFTSANNMTGSKKIIFSVVRYGNVMGSRGSVIPYFKKFENLGYLPITDIRMTRFNLKIEEAATFVLNSLNLMMGNEIFVPKLKSYKIVDLLEAIKPNANYKIVGIRSGEKLHEDLISIDESRYTIEFKKFYIIYNSYILQNKKYLIFIKSLRGKKVKNSFFYRSDKNNFLSVSQIKELINSLEDSKKNKF
jgi:nucleoside-diphosphate-sugar epimerase